MSTLEQDAQALASQEPRSLSDFYRAAAMQAVRRVAGNLDRRPWSDTFGCFDREYWFYKTLQDFPRPAFQQGIWPLALLYKQAFPGNEFTRNPAVLQWLQGGLDFWSRECHPDGPVDEWYRHERSFCATAFTSAAAGETLLLLGEEVDPACRRRVENCLEKTLHWLKRYPSRAASNQMAAAWLAAVSFSPKSSENWKKEFLTLQDAEGWFPEYGGPDIGYNLLTLSLLARVWDRTRDPDLSAALDKLLDFIGHFAHPQGWIGGIYGNRYTAHVFPHGIEYFAARGNQKAAAILPALRTTLLAGRVPLPATTDDTYAHYFYSTDFCLAACEEPLPVSGEAARPFCSQAFPNAGWVTHAGNAYQAVLNTRTGNWWAVSSDGKTITGDSGYVLVDQAGRCYGSGQGRFHSTAAHPKLSGDTLEVKSYAPFGKLDTSLPRKEHPFLFQAWTRGPLASPGLSRFFHRFLKRRNVYPPPLKGVTLSRTWVLKPDCVELTDEIRTDGSLSVKALYCAAEGTGMQSPSSQFYTPSLLGLEKPSALQEEAAMLRRQGHVQLHRVFF